MLNYFERSTPATSTPAKKIPTSQESERHNKPSDYEWVIDPIDGTQNFVHGIPHFCVSIACLYKGKIEHGVILDPIRQEEFVASRGHGCSFNGQRVRVRGTKDLETAVLATSGGGWYEENAAQGAVIAELMDMMPTFETVAAQRARSCLYCSRQTRRYVDAELESLGCGCRYVDGS